MKLERMSLVKKIPWGRVIFLILCILFVFLSGAVLIEPVNIFSFARYWLLNGVSLLIFLSVRMYIRTSPSSLMLTLFTLFNIALLLIPLVGVFETSLFESLWKVFYAGMIVLVGLDLLLLNRLISGKLSLKLDHIFLVFSSLLFFLIGGNVIFDFFIPFDYTAYIVVAGFTTLSIVFKLFKINRIVK